jgi:hypothetical protein
VSFSYNGGLTDVAQFNQDNGFFGETLARNDWVSSLGDVQDAIGTPGQVSPILVGASGPTPEAIVLSALGYTRLATRTIIEVAGATDLIRLDNNYFMFGHGTSSGPVLSYNGIPITAGQFGAWNPIGAEAVNGGYEVAWKLTGADSYSIWKIDSNGNYVSAIVAGVSGSTLALESAETTFQQDLNGDGTIGPTKKVIEADGGTDLVQLADTYFLYAHNTSSGPTLKFNAAPVTAGQLGGWTPIGAEAMNGGYEVAWKLTGADSYSIWQTDSNGNYVSAVFGGVSGSSLALESAETSFQQDLNGDGTTGPTKTVIQTDAGTDLVQLADTYFLYAHGTSTGPALSYNHVPVTVGALGGWTPIGAVAMNGGYEVAWKLAGADSYIIWNTDSSGNYASSPLGIMAGNSVALELAETSFQQDLNHDGVTGINLPKTVIEAAGSTDLVQITNTYFLYAHNTSSGPTLKFNGVPVTAGQLGGWTPIGAEAMNGGYEVAWKLMGADSYSIWQTDSNGNYVSVVAGGVSGSSLALESAETSFQQDLNGDGTTGPTKTVIQTDGGTDLVQLADTYFLYAHGTSTGPALSYNGAPATASKFGGWKPIGAVAVTGGYDVAWKLAGADSYVIWNTDSSGNYQTTLVGPVSGTTFGFEAYETIFQQDLNGDGNIGLPRTVIEAVGATDLVQLGNNYLLQAHGTTSGPLLRFDQTPVRVGEFGGWTPIGVEQLVSSLYEVVWKLAGSDSYSIWMTDRIGNYLSAPAAGVSGSTLAIESAETTLQQDLNGDGTTGPTRTVIQTDGGTDLVQLADTYFLYQHGTSTGPALNYNGAPATASEFGGWKPIGAVAVTGGYEIAWKLTGANSYTIWKTDSSGNYQSSLLGVVPGNNTALESAETTFQQDLNGDGHIGVPGSAGGVVFSSNGAGGTLINGGTSTTNGDGAFQIVFNPNNVQIQLTAGIGNGQTAHISSPSSAPVAFLGTSGTLLLDPSSDFTGTVSGMSGQDMIDFSDIKFITPQAPSYSGNSSGGTLTVSDGSHTANIALLGNYLASTFAASSDGHGGTSVIQVPSQSSAHDSIAHPQSS